MNDDIKILVCYHKPYKVYENDIFLPIQVGKKISNLNLDMQSDNQIDGNDCENISDLNNLYCEMTAMYWAWKNILTIYPNLNYIGLCHYRRYFCDRKFIIKDLKNIIFNKIKGMEKIALGKNSSFIVYDPIHKLKSNEAEDILRNSNLRKIVESSDIVTTNPVRVFGASINDFFNLIGKQYIDLMKKIVQEEYSEYYPFLESVLINSKLYDANMIILKTCYLDEYCSFVFGVMDRHVELVKKLGICDNPKTEKIYSRIPGYLSEILTSTYIYSKKGCLKISIVDKYFILED